jgi:CTP:molybdopterin cytidylyltransferase MocA
MTPGSGRERCCAVVLAAGQGRRFGGEKLLAKFRSAPLLAHPLRILADARAAGLIQRVLVVIPAGSDQLQELVRRSGATTVIQPDPSADLRSSLKLGLQAAQGSASALIVLGDQPLLRKETIAGVMIASAGRPDAIVRARYAANPGDPGHPVLVPSQWWHLADTPEGFRDTGDGRPPFDYLPLPGANPDVDTIEDLRALEGTTH